LVDIFALLGWISAISVIIPGVALLSLIRGVKLSSTRNLTILLASFAILHGFYHISVLAGYADFGYYLDFATAVMLVALGLYYSEKITGLALLLLSFPDAVRDAVPIALIVALILFARLAIKSRSLSSLQSQLSIFLVIWTIAELLRSLLILNLISASYSLQLLGFEIHTAAMIAFGVFMLSRYYKVVSRTGNDADKVKVVLSTSEQKKVSEQSVTRN
jgi:hypothetical protein